MLVHPPPSQQLDGQMHKMMADKQKRRQQIEGDSAAIESLEEQIRHHIAPNLVRAVAGSMVTDSIGPVWLWCGAVLAQFDNFNCCHESGHGVCW
jgi:hypothetical protein